MSETKPDAQPTDAEPKPPEASVVMGGTCDPAFRDVEDAFAENLRSRDEIGGAVCIRKMAASSSISGADMPTD